MKKQIRRKVFETNSSSMHSLSVCPNGIESKLIVDSYENKVIAEFGEFGCGVESFTDAETKLSYLLTMVSVLNGEPKEEEFYELDDFQRINDVVKEHCNCDGIMIDNFEVWHYVDHQSVCGIDELLSDYGECTIDEFIFDTGVELIIDNDNH